MHPLPHSCLTMCAAIKAAKTNRSLVHEQFIWTSDASDTRRVLHQHHCPIVALSRATPSRPPVAAVNTRRLSKKSMSKMPAANLRFSPQVTGNIAPQGYSVLVPRYFEYAYHECGSFHHGSTGAQASRGQEGAAGGARGSLAGHTGGRGCRERKCSSGGSERVPLAGPVVHQRRGRVGRGSGGAQRACAGACTHQHRLRCMSITACGVCVSLARMLICIVTLAAYLHARAAMCR